MFREFGCHGRVVLGKLPEDLSRCLEELPGDWLEYDAAQGAIVVRHVQPSSTPVLPTAIAELVQMLASIPYELQAHIEGGDLFVHTEEGGRLVRITVERGAAVGIRWAHPDYAGALKRPFDGHEVAIEPYEQRLNGAAAFSSLEPERAAKELQDLADNFEGLYPEGDFLAVADPSGGIVRVKMKDVNLDVLQLLNAMQRLATPRTLTGRIALSSFGESVPEHLLRILLENGEIWVQRPLLWSETMQGA